jgi:hypothetical protein
MPIIAVPSSAVYVDGFGFVVVFIKGLLWVISIKAFLPVLVVALKTLAAAKSDQSTVCCR